MLTNVIHKDYMSTARQPTEGVILLNQNRFPHSLKSLTSISPGAAAGRAVRFVEGLWYLESCRPFRVDWAWLDEGPKGHAVPSEGRLSRFSLFLLFLLLPFQTVILGYLSSSCPLHLSRKKYPPMHTNFFLRRLPLGGVWSSGSSFNYALINPERPAGLKISLVPEDPSHPPSQTVHRAYAHRRGNKFQTFAREGRTSSDI